MTPAPMKHAEESAAHWPIGSMLGIGTFGPQSPGGRRYHLRVWLALGVLVVGTMLAAAAQARSDFWLWAWAPAILIGSAFSFIAHALWQYVSGLDELSRALQLEAMAITYLIGMAVFMTLGGIGLVVPWQMTPLSYIGLDIIRGAALVVLARRYR